MKIQDIKVGTQVTYYGVIKQDGTKHLPYETEIVSEPWELGHGEVVCKVKGKFGGVSIHHLELR